MRSQSTRRWTRLLALLLGLAMVAAACGGDDDTADGGNNDEGPTDSEPDESDAGDPVPGGKLVYGVEADTSTPWTPANSVCAISCHMIMRSVFDTLTLFAEDGSVQPNLLESFEPNDDFTAWTLTPKSGITFHDGTPFDAAAIKANLDAHLVSFLTAKALLNVESVDLSEDGSAAVVTMKSPWNRFPSFLSGQIGYQASPTWLAAVAEDPTLAASPVGTGPFVFKSYEVGGSFIATKNAEYWRADEGLPYLDEIEYRVLADGQARKNALLSGDIDIMHTSAGLVISDLRKEDGIELTENSSYGETNYTLMNVGNPDSPISDVRIRKALAMAIDNEVLIERRGAGIGMVANGPFSPDQKGYLEETPYPEYDPEGAKALVDEYKAEKGVSSVDIAYTTTTDPANLETGELVKQFWDQVGLNVELAQIEQGAFIVTALSGDFEMFGWRNHGGVDPDSQRIWWHSETADDIGALALNFGRITDDVIDENLDKLRQTTDEAEITAAAEAINTQFGEQVYNLWSSWTVWGIAKDPKVNGLDTFVLPDGTPEIYGNGIGGSHQVSQLWIGE
ncbi:ABC transporter substrate-binding protein [Actinospongicola halichondriae]|uniref:ABC transporter substrate-binding protein n=1 Tax=Actinospongicola halichondriae TaxID=3236844 RepID=UPI003D5039F2